MTRTSRRAFLAVVGGLTVSSAGCVSSETDSDDTGPTRFEPGELEQILPTSPPVIERPIPIEPAEQAIASRSGVVESIISSVPSVITESTIPNGTIRDEIDHRKSDAADTRSEALSQSGRFHSIRMLSDAQGLARDAHTMYSSATGELTPNTVEEEQATTKREINQRIPSLRYIGDSIHQLILLYYWLESDLISARNQLSQTHRERQNNPIRLGEIGNAIGVARGMLDATSHFESRQEDRVQNASTRYPAVEQACSRALTSLREYEQFRNEDPSEQVTVDINETPAERILWTANGGYRNSIQQLIDHRTEGTVAAGLHRAVNAFTRFHAYSTLLDRVNDGEFTELTSVDPVIEARDSIQSFLMEPPFTTETPTIVRDHFAEIASWVSATDDNIERYVSNGISTSIVREYAEYVHLEHRLRAMPDAERAYNSWTKPD